MGIMLWISHDDFLFVIYRSIIRFETTNSDFFCKTRCMNMKYVHGTQRNATHCHDLTRPSKQHSSFGLLGLSRGLFGLFAFRLG